MRRRKGNFGLPMIPRNISTGKKQKELFFPALNLLPKLFECDCHSNNFCTGKVLDRDLPETFIHLPSFELLFKIIH
jgi:hypothetical protein